MLVRRRVRTRRRRSRRGSEPCGLMACRLAGWLAAECVARGGEGVLLEIEYAGACEESQLGKQKRQCQYHISAL